MKLAIDTFSFYMHFGKHWYKPEKPYDIHWYCELSRKLRADGLHIDPYHIDLDRDIPWVRKFAEENHMYIELGACGTSPGELIPYINAAEKLGAKLLRTFVGGSCLDGRSITRERTVKAKTGLTEVLPAASKSGIKIAVENHGDIFIEDMLEILKIESGSLGVCFDSGNFAFTGENPLDGINAFGDRILCTHLKDVCYKEAFPGAEPFDTVRDQVHFCALGDGYLPMDDIISRLNNVGIKNLTIEICSPCIETMPEDELLKFEMNNVNKSISFIKNSVAG